MAFLVLAVVSLVSVVGAHDARVALRTPQPQLAAPGHGLLISESTPRLSVGAVHVIAVAALENAPVPPGLEVIPREGEMVVSPSLRHEARLHSLLPYRLVGVVTRHGLASGDEKLVYVGVSTQAMQASTHADRGIARFGVAPSKSSWLWPAVLAGLVGLLAPFLLCLVALIRLNLAGRSANAARLHVLGVARGQVAVLSSAKFTGSVAVGSWAGGSIYWLLARQVSALPWVGARLFPGDVAAPMWAWIAVAVGLPVMAALIARGQTTSVNSSGSARAHSLVKTRRHWAAVGSLVVGLAGLGLVAYVPVDVRNSDGWSYALIAGSSVFVIALLASLPTIVGLVFDRMLTISALPVYLAARRASRRPVASTRLAGLFAALLFLVGALAPLIAQESDPGPAAARSEREDSRVLAQAVLLPDSDMVDDLRGQQYVLVAESLYEPPSSNGLVSAVAFVSCRELHVIAGTSRGPCPSGPVQLTRESGTVGSMGELHLPGKTEKLQIAGYSAPESAVLEYPGLVLMPPTQRMADLQFAGSALIAFRSLPFPPASTLPVLDTLAATAPMAQLQSSVLSSYWGAEENDVPTELLVAVLAVLAIVSLVAIAAAGLTAWTLRRSHFMGTIALGAQPRLLRQSFMVELAVGMLIAVSISGVAIAMVARAGSRLTGSSGLDTSQYASVMGLGSMAGLATVIATVGMARFKFSLQMLRTD